MSNEHALPPPLKRAEDDINLYSNVSLAINKLTKHIISRKASEILH